MREKGRDPATGEDSFTQKKAEAEKFVETIQQRSKMAQARVLGMLEGGVAMWEMLNAENPQKQ